MQKITIQVAPNMSVEIDGNHETELFRAAAFWLDLPKTCPVCGNTLILSFRTPKDFTYYGLRCVAVKSHTVNLGEMKDGHHLYFDRSKPWTVWGSADPATSETASSTNAQENAAIPSPAAGQSAPVADPFALTPPPAATHPNDPNTVRGKMLKSISEIRTKAAAHKVDLSGIDFADLGSKSDEAIADIGRKVRHKIESFAFEPTQPAK